VVPSPRPAAVPPRFGVLPLPASATSPAAACVLLPSSASPRTNILRGTEGSAALEVPATDATPSVLSPLLAPPSHRAGASGRAPSGRGRALSWGAPQPHPQPAQGLRQKFPLPLCLWLAGASLPVAAPVPWHCSCCCARTPPSLSLWQSGPSMPCTLCLLPAIAHDACAVRSSRFCSCLACSSHSCCSPATQRLADTTARALADTAAHALAGTTASALACTTASPLAHTTARAVVETTAATAAAHPAPGPILARSRSRDRPEKTRLSEREMHCRTSSRVTSNNGSETRTPTSGSTPQTTALFLAVLVTLTQ